MVAPRFRQFPKSVFFRGRTTENSKIGLSRICLKKQDVQTEANGGDTRARGYYALWKYYIWNFRTWL